MADHTKIEWTDATWNPITGCTVVSPGCTNCYAMKLAGTRLRHHPSRAGLTSDSKAGPVWNGQVRFNEDWLTQPLTWSRPRRIFVCAHGDLFHESVPDEWIDMVFAVMALSPQHTFQVLTKRSERMWSYLTDPLTPARIASDGLNEVTVGFATRHPLVFNGAWPLPNALLGASVEDQRRADERRDHLGPLSRRYGWRTFVSYEPALGPVDWTGWEFLSWLISGGESGPGARPSHPDWHRAARDFCAANGIPYHFKQWGEWASALHINGVTAISSAPADNGHWAHPHRRRVHGGALDRQCFEGHPTNHNWLRVGKARAGRRLDGVEHNGMPEALT